MKRLLIIYRFQKINTEIMRNAMSKGASPVGKTVGLQKTVDTKSGELLGHNAAAIGTLNYFSYVAASILSPILTPKVKEN